MNKQYEYNGKQYKLKPLTLGVMKDIMPLLVRLRKHVYNYTSDIDMTEVNKARQRIADFEKAKEQLGEKLEGDLLNDERLHIINRLNNLGEKITLHKTELESDNRLAEKIKLYNECSSFAVIELLSDVKLVKPAINSLIECADGDVEINTEDPAAVKFILQILTDFFLLIKMNSAGLTG